MLIDNDEPARWTLAKILTDPNNVSFDKYDRRAMEELFTRCALKMVARTICEAADYRTEAALSGVEFVTAFLQREIGERCKERN